MFKKYENLLRSSIGAEDYIQKMKATYSQISLSYILSSMQNSSDIDLSLIPPFLIHQHRSEIEQCLKHLKNPIAKKIEFFLTCGIIDGEFIHPQEFQPLNRFIHSLPMPISIFNSQHPLFHYKGATSSGHHIIIQDTHIIEIQISNMGLTSIPEEIGLFPFLHLLDISNNQICHLPLSLDKLKNLEFFYLFSNSFLEVPPVLGGLSNLDLNSLCEFPDIDNDFSFEEMEEFLNKKYLISKWDIESLKHRISIDSSLTEIDCLHPKLNDYAQKLRNYCISYSSFKISKDLENIISEREILLTIEKKIDHSITYLPRENSPVGFDVKNARIDRLNLRNCNIFTVPDEITALRGLEYLDLSNNPLSILPLSFIKLQNLKGFTLNNVNLQEFPLFLLFLPQKVSLDFEGMRELPKISEEILDHYVEGDLKDFLLPLYKDWKIENLIKRLAENSPASILDKIHPYLLKMVPILEDKLSSIDTSSAHDFRLFLHLISQRPLNGTSLPIYL